MKTTIDYMTFRSQSDPQQALEALRPMFGSLGQDLRLKPLERGAMGFQQACQVVVHDVPLARFDYGGESQRGWVRSSMSGKGCEWVQDWAAAQEIEALPSAQLRRLDIALTTWHGEVTHDRVVQAHKDQRFTYFGRPPALQQIISSDTRAGQTCYVGKRTSDKFFRGYEKGFEMVSKMGRMPGMCTHIDGFKVEDIYRCEIEFKSSATNIGWDVIERRDEFFAGSYPFCAELLPEVDADILQRRPERAPQSDLASALANCKIQYGSVLFTALKAYHGDMTTVWDKVFGDHDCQTLIEAGVLLVEHE